MSDIGTHASYTRGPPPQGQQKSYEFSEDEKRVMAECRSESFWYRALPFSIGAGGLTKYLLSRGILTTGTRFGAAPKVFFASIFGYMVGKGTYIFKCQEKIMRLENSQLAEALRKRRMPGANNQVQMPPSPTAPQESSESFGVPLSDTQRSDTHVNLDIDTSNVKNIDDYETLAPAEEPVNEKPKMTTTYEDLRNQNRRNVPTYSSQYAQPKPPAAPGPASQEASQSWEQGRQQQTSSPPPNSQTQRQQDAAAFPLGRSQKNKYGDDWE